MHTKDIEYAISMVAHPKAQTIRSKALAQLNSLLNRIVELEAAQQSVQRTGGYGGEKWQALQTRPSLTQTVGLLKGVK